MESSNTAIPDTQDIESGKTIAILSYITLIGWIIAYVMHTSTKTKFGAFHIRQALGLMVLGIGIFVISFGFLFISYYLYYIFRLVNLAVFVMAIMGIVNAANGKMQKVPLLGDFFDKTFSGIN
jgi:uncharacterized membrane protein